MISLLECGVVGNGGIETEAIQGVIDGAPEGSTILFSTPPVRYVIDKPLRVNKNLTLRGDSSGVVIDNWGPGAAFLINPSSPGKRIFIENLTITRGQCGIQVSGSGAPSDYCQFTDLVILSHSLAGIKIDTPAQGSAFFSIAISGGAYGVYGAPASVGLHGLQFDDLQVEGALSSAVFLVEPSPTTSNIQFLRPNFIGCTQNFSTSNCSVELIGANSAVLTGTLPSSTTLYSLQTPSTIHYYVSEISGSDSNDGLSAAFPLKTLGASGLSKKINSFTSIQHDIIVHIGKSSSSVGYDPPTITSKNLNANIYLYGDGAGQSGEDGFTELYGGTVQAGTSRISLVSSGSLTTNQFRGKVIQILSGAIAGEFRTIRDNNTTNLNLCWGFSAIPANGVGYRIVEPEVDISFTDNLTNGDHVLVEGCGLQDRADGFPGGRYGIWFVNQRWRLSLAATTQIHMRNSRIFLMGIEYQESNNFLWNTAGSFVGVGFEISDQSLARVVRSPVSASLAATNTSWQGWGISSIGTPTTTAPIFQIYDSSWFILAIVIPRFSVFSNSFVRLEGGNIYGQANGTAGPTVQAAGPAAVINIAGESATSNNVLITNTSSTAAVVDCIGAGSTITMSRVICSGTSGPGIKSSVPSFFSLTTGTQVTAGTFAIIARNGGNVQVSTNVTVVTGSIGDLTVDELTGSAISLSQIPSVSDKIVSLSEASAIIRT